ncbi:MAG: GNAT family N-acetyltransferase [Lagierella massiliensis]|nr:GNAT family N-acetyltransferase [Lagierella massiliensis]
MGKNNKLKKQDNKIIIKDNELIISKLTLQDAIYMRNWENHNNALFEDYNFNGNNENFQVIWYYSKGIGYKNKYYAVKLSNELIGYIAIKAIKYLKKTSILGLVFNPAYTSQGFGYRSMMLFLDYYFNEFHMNEMTLDVNQFNYRAINLYNKLGFKYQYEYLGVFENQNIDFNDPIYEKYKEDFVVQNGKIYSIIHNMSIDKKTFI